MKIFARRGLETNNLDFPRAYGIYMESHIFGWTIEGTSAEQTMIACLTNKYAYLETRHLDVGVCDFAYKRREYMLRQGIRSPAYRIG